MASQRIGETGFSDSGPSSDHHHNHYAMLPGLDHPGGAGFSHPVGSGFDFGELEQAIAPQGLQFGNNDLRPSLYEGRPATTLEMFPPWPIRLLDAPARVGNSREADSGSALNTRPSCKGEPPLEPDSPNSATLPSSNYLQAFGYQEDEPGGRRSQQEEMFDMGSDNGSHSGAGNLQQIIVKPEKTLRRLAQNREAARKSRLRKKAYVQQLESSRIKLAQLEQDLQRARSQGLFLGVGGAAANVSSGAVLFDLEYARWLDENHRHMSKLQAALQTPHVSDGELRAMVDACVSHYDEIFHLKGMAAKADVFHLFTGMWTTPAERCFLWMGGFRPCELIKMLITQLHPLTEQQVIGICNLQHSSQQAEEALTQGLEQLQQSVVDTIAAGCVSDDFEHMNMALARLVNLEGFMRQADNLRQQTLHQLCRILTVRQAAKCFVVIGEYHYRLRALSTLWSSRPRDVLICDDKSCQTTATMAAADLPMAQCQQPHFPDF